MKEDDLVHQWKAAQQALFEDIGPGRLRILATATDSWIAIPKLKAPAQNEMSH